MLFRLITTRYRGRANPHGVSTIPNSVLALAAGMPRQGGKAASGTASRGTTVRPRFRTPPFDQAFRPDRPRPRRPLPPWRGRWPWRGSAGSAAMRLAAWRGDGRQHFQLSLEPCAMCCRARTTHTARARCVFNPAVRPPNAGSDQRARKDLGTGLLLHRDVSPARGWREAGARLRRPLETGRGSGVLLP